MIWKSSDGDMRVHADETRDMVWIDVGESNSLDPFISIPLTLKEIASFGHAIHDYFTRRGLRNVSSDRCGDKLC